MFIDFVTLLLINMSAGFFLLACYVYKGIEEDEQRKWRPAFAMVGLIALINGLYMSWTWPLPGSYNVTFAEMSVFFGILFLGATFALAKKEALIPVAIYAFFAGLAATLIGIRIINLSLTKEPLLSGIGFIISGLSGIFALPVIYLRKNKILRTVVAALLIVAAIIWARTGYSAYWDHLSSLSKWLPTTMR